MALYLLSCTQSLSMFGLTDLSFSCNVIPELMANGLVSPQSLGYTCSLLFYEQPILYNITWIGLFYINGSSSITVIIDKEYSYKVRW